MPEMDTRLLDWLSAEGGTVIRYRTATELLEPGAVNLAPLIRDLLNAPAVRLWISRLQPGELHHSKPEAFENVAGKLAELGVGAGMPPFDERIGYFLELLENWEDRPRSFSYLFVPLLAAGLARTGLVDHPGVLSAMEERMAAIGKVTALPDYEIYVSDDDLPVLPRAFADKHFVSPRFFTGADLNLPSIHDLLAIAHCQSGLAERGWSAGIAELVGYILDPGYQELDPGYGYMWTQDDGQRKYYAVGWSVHLPGYFGFDLERDQQAALITRLEMMARFSTARRHPWFTRCLEHLEGFRQDGGTYILPRSYLREVRSGYGVSGNYMGLEENRRSLKAIELESTFRMLRLRNQV